MLDQTLAWMKTRGIAYAEHPIAAKNRLGKTIWKKRGFEAATIFRREKITQG